MATTRLADRDVATRLSAMDALAEADGACAPASASATPVRETRPGDARAVEPPTTAALPPSGARFFSEDRTAREGTDATSRVTTGNDEAAREGADATSRVPTEAEALAERRKLMTELVRKGLRMFAEAQREKAADRNVCPMPRAKLVARGKG